jgi:VWFA-related protein
MMLALVLVLAAAAAGEQQQQQPTFAVGTERVTVDVVVIDSEGRPVTGLLREDFVVKEEGAVQPVLDFEAVDVMAVADAEREPVPEEPVASNAPSSSAGRHFLIVFDDVNIAVANTERVRKAVRSFLERQLRDGDEVTMVSTAGGGFWAGRVPEDNEDLLAFLGTLMGRRMVNFARDRISDAEAMRIHIDRDQEALTHVVLRFESYALLGPGLGLDTEDRAGALASARSSARPYVEALAADTYLKARERLRQSLGALESAIATLGGRRGRRAVLLASDGFIQDRKLDELDRVREVSRRANAALYFVDARGVDTQQTVPLDIPIPPDLGNLSGYIQRAREFALDESAGAEALAADTGGFTIKGNDLSPGLGRLSLESRSFYLLGYEPANKKRDGKFRKIEVQVRRPGVVVRARKGYNAGLPGAEKQASTSPAGALQAFQGALEGRDIPLRMAAYVLNDAGNGKATVLLSAEADPNAVALEEKEGRLVGGIDSSSSLASRDTGEVGSKQRTFQLALRPEVRRRLDTAWIQMTHSFELPPGRYQATFVARDRGSPRVGAVRLKVDVPDLSELRITTPVLSDTLIPGATPQDPGTPAPLARRRFTAGTRLFARFEVADGRHEASRVVITYEVKRADGTLVTGTAPTPLEPGSDGVLARVFSLTLNRPGGYRLELVARDPTSGRQAGASADFEVVAPEG